MSRDEPQYHCRMEDAARLLGRVADNLLNLRAHPECPVARAPARRYLQLQKAPRM